MKQEAKKISNAAAGALFLHLAATIAVRFVHGRLVFTLDAAEQLYDIAASMLVLFVAYFSFNAFSKRLGWHPATTSRRNRGTIPETIALTLICGASVFLLGKVYSSLFSDQSYSMISASDGVYEYILAFILYVVVPVFFEELVFRFCFAREFQIFGAIGAIILSSLLFGLTHFSFSAFPYAFVSGIVISAAYLHTGRPAAPLGIHFINNAMGFILSAAYVNVPDSKTISTWSTVIPIVMIVAGSVLLFIGRKKKLPEAEEEEHALVSDALTPAMSLYLVCAVIVHIFM